MLSLHFEVFDPFWRTWTLDQSIKTKHEYDKILFRDYIFNKIFSFIKCPVKFRKKSDKIFLYQKLLILLEEFHSHFSFEKKLLFNSWGHSYIFLHFFFIIRVKLFLEFVTWTSSVSDLKNHNKWVEDFCPSRNYSKTFNKLTLNFNFPRTHLDSIPFESENFQAYISHEKLFNLIDKLEYSITKKFVEL